MKEALKGKIKLAICALGIFVFYFLYGILQERITRGKYGDERFTHVLTLVFIQCVANYVFAILVLRFFLKQGDDTTKTSYYVIGAFTYLLAMVASNKALLWVNYPTQVVAKSCKPIPVLILGVILAGKRYTPLKYLFILMIVTGVGLFIYKDDKKTSASSEATFGLGEALLVLSLLCDGLVASVQERMRSEHGTKSGHLMKNVNLWSVLFLGVGILVTGELWSFVGFVERHPKVIGEIASFSVASCLGQFFIFMCVADFGPLTCSIITTTRKFFTVLGSVIFFGNVLITRQWIGTILVFTGLILDGIFGKSKPTVVAKPLD